MTSIDLPFSPAALFRNLPREALFGGLVALASAARSRRRDLCDPA